MSLYKDFSTEKKSEVEGKWLAVSNDVRILLRRAGGSNSAYQQMFAKLIRPVRRQVDNNTLPQKKMLEIMAKGYAHTVVLDWESREIAEDGETWKLKKNNIMGPDGKWIPCTPENIEKVLLDLPDLFDVIRDAATSYSLFQAEEEEADAGK